MGVANTMSPDLNAPPVKEILLNPLQSRWHPVLDRQDQSPPFHYAPERLHFNLRLEARNFFNHASYGSLITDPGSPVFGGVSGKHGNRIMQLALRLFF